MSGTATRDNFRRIAHRIRAIPGKRFGLRPYTVSVTHRVHSGTYTGDGTITDATTTIAEADGQPPKVRWLDGEELALGELPGGSVEVGPITPDFSGGGTSLTTLQGGSSVSDQDEVFYTLTGPEFPSGAKYMLHDVRTDRALHYMVTLRPMEKP